ncbi:MAG: DUF1573 domain-containing protein [Deltaproteobacteria bacterium]|nr:DUF1573 domain-containing protein [Deltaproteobacteria bacterium]
MHRYLLLVIFFLLTVGFVSPVAAEDKLASILQIEEPVYNFGTIESGKRVKKNFLLKNISDKEIKIIDVRPDCGCISTLAGEKLIAKGEETEIEVTFNTAGFSGFKSKVIRVYLDNAQVPYFFLRLEGTVLSDYTITPNRIYFSEVETKQQGLSQKVAIISNEGLNMICKEALVDNERVKVEITAAQGKQIELTATLIPPFPVGPLRVNIKAAVDIQGKGVRAFSIPLLAMIKSAYEITPAEVSLGLIKPESLASVGETVKVDFKKEINAENISVNSSNELVVADLVKTEGSVAILRIALKSSASGNVRAHVAVRLEGEETEGISIPVYAIVAKQGE